VNLLAEDLEYSFLNSYSGKAAYRGDIASNYERDRVNEPVWAIEQAWMEKWASNLTQGARILDVPAGTGRFVGIFLARGAKVTAIDVSEDMLTELRRRWPPDADRLVVLRGDVEFLPYEPDSFDYVVSWRLFHLIPRLVVDRVLLEFARVCRGSVVIQVFGVRPGLLTRIFHAVQRRFRRPPSTAPLSGTLVESTPWAHIHSYSHAESDLRASFKNAGFTLERSVTLDNEGGGINRVYFLRRH
jgi:ubiquinone/menaquinone biosynthesis C-methylase UbiE